VRRFSTLLLAIGMAVVWTGAALAQDNVRASLTVRGFNVLLWRDRDLGYALVSDLNVGDLRVLGTRLAAP
jgi:hypothetical protein